MTRRLAATVIAIAAGSCATDEGLTDDGHELDTVLIAPSVAWLSVGDSLPFRARVFDRAGRELGSETVVWTSRNPETASISMDGSARGAATGSTHVVAQVDGLEDSAQVHVSQARTGASAGDNEPEGHRPIASHAFRCIPGNGCEGEAGTWWTRPRDVEDGRVSLVEEGLEVLFPSGWEDGRSPARIDAWSSAGSGVDEYHSVYVRMEIKLVGSDWENQTVGTKIFYLAYGDDRRQNHGYLMQSHGGRQAARPHFSLNPWLSEARPDGTMPGGGAVRRRANVRADSVLVTGEWHEVELLMELNDPGGNGGRARLWVDGAKTHDIRGLRFRGSVDSMGFHWFQLTPVYGGMSGDVRTRNDSMRFRSLYISGGSGSRRPPR